MSTPTKGRSTLKLVKARAQRQELRMPAEKMYDPKGDPFFEQLKVDVLEGFAFAERGPCIGAEESIAEARATIARVAARRLAAGDGPANDDDDDDE